jgi:predicted dehydrogenase
MYTDRRLADDMLFEDWSGIAARPKLADAVVVAVLDQLHAPVVSAFAKLGYHILVEKPMATSIPDCINMVREVQAGKPTDGSASLVFGVGHVLRYSPYNALLKEVLDSGAVGEIVNIQHMEPVGNEHFAHSFVRGNWKSEGETTFALMAKCCQ